MFISNRVALPLLMAAAAVRGDSAASKAMAASEVITASEAIVIPEAAAMKPECGDVLTFYHFSDVVSLSPKLHHSEHSSHRTSTSSITLLTVSMWDGSQPSSARLGRDSTLSSSRAPSPRALLHS